VSAESLELIVPAHLAGERLDQALAEMSGLTRTRLRQLLDEGRLTPPAKPSARAVFGERYLLEIPPPVALDLSPEAIALDILFEDDHLLIVNKPAGMVVHPSHGHDSGTLVHALLAHCPHLPGIGGVERPGIVHRLDRDTSGSLVVAKSEPAHLGLTDLFARHDIDRQYLAWCRGAPHWGYKRIELPIGRHPHQRQKMAVVTGGKRAITEARLERNFGPYSRLRLMLHTGRTHQIRVHLSHEHLPILGDTTYGRAHPAGNSVPEPARSCINGLDRQALHAEVLGFVHPISGEQIRVLAPLPPELVALNAALEAMTHG